MSELVTECGRVQLRTMVSHGRVMNPLLVWQDAYNYLHCHETADPPF